MNIGAGRAGDGNRYFMYIQRHAPLKIFKTKFPSLLISFIMSVVGKYKTSLVDYLQCLFKMFLIQNYYSLTLLNEGSLNFKGTYLTLLALYIKCFFLLGKLVFVYLVYF